MAENDGGSLLLRALQAETEAEARDYLGLLVARCVVARGISKAEAVVQVRVDLAYSAGYHGQATRERIERLYQCVHPFFGPASRGPVDSTEAFRLGVELGENLKKGLPMKYAYEQPPYDPDTVQIPFEERLQAKMREVYGGEE